MGSDDDWEFYGAHNPYFGVLTESRFDARNLDARARQAFFQTGQAHVARVLEQLAALADRSGAGPLAVQNALDFGCGVGRLSLPLARACQQVTGLDVSPSMLAEARANAAQQGIGNVYFLQADDGLSTIAGQHFDLLISHLVFQHIPVARGKHIFCALLDHLAPGALGAVDFIYDKERRLGALRDAVKRVPLARRLHDLSSGRGLQNPPMEMNDYPLAWLLRQLHARGVQQLQLDLGRDGHCHTATLLFRLPD